VKQKRFKLAILLTLLLGCVITYGQGTLGPTPKKVRTPDDYKSRSMKEVSARDIEKLSPGDTDKVILRGDILPSRVRLTYAARARLLPQAKKDVLSRWARLYAGAPEHYTEPYETELLFREGRTDYWVAVRKQAKAQFEREVKIRMTVDLYLIRLGWARTGTEWEPLILMESSQRPK